MNTDKVLDKICELTPYIEEIVKDKEISKILADKAKVNSNDKDEILEQGFNKGLENILKFVPILLKTHRESVYGIISVMNEKDIEEIKNQSILETIKQFNELLRDKELVAVFTSFTV